MDRLVKGIWIPIEIWQDQSLSWNEKILLMEIDSFTSKGHDCYISNEYIANLLQVTDRSARKYLSHLMQAGYIRMVRFDGRERYVESTLSFQAEWNDSSRQGGQSVPHTDNNEYINKIDREGAQGKFKKPTLQEVAEYCQERGNNIDPEEFIAHYESNGWKVGKTPMKNWKSAIVTWEKKREKDAPKKKGSSRKESVLEHNLKVMDELYGTNIHQQVYGKDE